MVPDRTVKATGTLPASSLDLAQRSALHGLVCRAFRDRERAIDAADALALTLSRDLPLDHAWQRAIDQLRKRGDDLGPLASMALSALPDDPEWRRIPKLDALRALGFRAPTRAKTDSDGRPLVAKLRRVGAPSNEWGTAWRIDESRVLTAAHCVGDRARQTLKASAVTLEFPQGEVLADLREDDVDWAHDAALLTLREAVRDGLAPALSTTLQAGDSWRVWGFPNAMETGMVATGTVADPDGEMPTTDGDARVCAVQLTCDQGGLGDLEGFSGAPVWARGGVAAMVRWGTLKQRVIYATPISALLSRFTPRRSP